MRFVIFITFTTLASNNCNLNFGFSEKAANYYYDHYNQVAVTRNCCYLHEIRLLLALQLGLEVRFFGRGLHIPYVSRVLSRHRVWSVVCYKIAGIISVAFYLTYTASFGWTA